MSGTRLKFYSKTWTSAGRWVYGVWMDEYGRIVKGYDKPDVKPSNYSFTGECGAANH